MRRPDLQRSRSRRRSSSSSPGRRSSMLGRCVRLLATLGLLLERRRAASRASCTRPRELAALLLERLVLPAQPLHELGRLADLLLEQLEAVVHRMPHSPRISAPAARRARTDALHGRLHLVAGQRARRVLERRATGQADLARRRPARPRSGPTTAHVAQQLAGRRADARLERRRARRRGRTATDRSRATAGRARQRPEARGGRPAPPAAGPAHLGHDTTSSRSSQAARRTSGCSAPSVAEQRGRRQRDGADLPGCSSAGSAVRAPASTASTPQPLGQRARAAPFTSKKSAVRGRARPVGGAGLPGQQDAQALLLRGPAPARRAGTRGPARTPRTSRRPWRRFGCRRRQQARARPASCAARPAPRRAGSASATARRARRRPARPTTNA